MLLKPSKKMAKAKWNKRSLIQHLLSLPKPYFSPAVFVGKSKIAGSGLVARRNIAKGEILVVERGPIVDLKFIDLIASKTGYDTDLCVGWGKYILHAPLHKDNQGGYINHSCDPNAGLIADGVWVSLRRIVKGKEIFCDYGTFETSLGWKMECRCGAKRCRHWITSNDWKRKDLQRKLGPYFAPYLKKEIKK